MDKPKKICQNEVDPFTMEELESFPERFIFYLGNFCFHLPSFFDWIFNREESTNPYTRGELTEQDKEKLKEAAMQEFPMKAKILSITGPTISLTTTSLTSLKRLFMNIMIRLGETVNNSLYQAITLAVRKDIGIFVSIGGRSQLLSSLMVEDPNKQLLEFDLPLEVKFMVTRLNGPKIKMDYLEDFRKVFLQFQYPTDEIDQRTREMRQALERQELNQPTLRARQEQERIRNLQYQRNAEIPEPGPGEIRINVSINTTGGWNLGSVPVNIDTDSQLFALELLVRERLVQEFNLPETRYRYVFAGRLYREDDRVSDIVGLSNGMTIYMTD